MTDSEMKEMLRKQLSDLEDKSEWEGGLGPMILDYGGHEMFPASCRVYVSGMVEAWEGLRKELARLSDYCGGTRNAW